MLANSFLNFDFYQNMLTITILIFGYVIVFFFSSTNKNDLKVISIIYFWHTLFSFIYFLYTISNPADAKAYYLKSLLIDSYEFNLGTKFVTYITYLFSQGLDASYLNVTLIFNIFASIGLSVFYLCLKKFFIHISKYYILVVFIPSMSFWSAGLGKDSISFFSTCLFLYAITSSKRARLSIFISFFFMFMVRPHIALMMLVSYVFYFIVKAKINLVFKLLTLPIIILAVVLSIAIVQQYVGLEEASLSGIDDYVDQRQSYNQGGGSSLDISSMSYPMQIFTYVFRPLPFDASSALTLFSSLENTIILLLFIYILYKVKFRSFTEDKNLWLLMYVFLTCTILAVTTSNLGIATRQKWMFMPVLFYLIIHAFYNYKMKSHKVY